MPPRSPEGSDGDAEPETTSSTGTWRDLDEILELVTAAPPERRNELLDEACHGDPELRAEVESLLSHIQPAEALFADLSERFTKGDPPSEGGGAVPEPGTYIGGYRLVRALPGGMSSVFEAWDEASDRPVVVKLAREERDRRARDRLVREAQADTALKHENVCRLIEAGVTPDLRPFLVLEFCEGSTLSARLKEGVPGLSAAVSVGRQVAGALAEAHGLGIVHRDIKAENVMVDDEGFVKLLDFGSAKVGEGALTAPGVVVGTPIYMSPEQLRGDAVSSATDVWSLGVVMFECITGEHPFRGSSKRRTLMNILHTPAPTLGSRGVEVPEDVEVVVGLALSPDPRPRPAAKDLAADLARIEAGL